MNDQLELQSTGPGECAVAIKGGPELWRYTYEPRTPANEAPRPFVHPVYSLDGDVLTNWRPNDHPWHHALSLTLVSVDGVNFWGGPTHNPADGYQWRGDHGVQAHQGWISQTPGRLVQRLEWRDPQRDQRVLIVEERELTTTLHVDAWTLRWTSRLTNPGATDLRCENYHSLGGLAGSHYSGLQFRGARGLLDQHGDARIRLLGEAGEGTVDALHGNAARWIEWHTQHDGTLRRTRIRFESLSGPIPWFVRPADPLVAFSPHREESWWLRAHQTRVLDHALHFQRI